MNDASVAQPRAINRLDYQPPAYQVSFVDLVFELDPAATVVHAQLQVTPTRAGMPLIMNAEAMTVLTVAIDGVPVSGWRHANDQLVLDPISHNATVATSVRLEPRANTTLEGLYCSGRLFCTQCEAEGFRRITPFIDRPDVMATYRVRVEADAVRYPVLLSNGNRTEAGPLPGDRHYAVFEDPFAKPSYLFALVAGDLIGIHDHFVTASGRRVELGIFVEPGNEHKCAHAMEALKQSMRWDEDVFGLEYDLDVFNIVAVDDFNFGAMENKSLNIFNSKYVLADPDVATDQDYANIESVVAHEYFHNWTGNRVTCRDWFQLSLKEGLTVFRDQWFSADQSDAAVKRIMDVRRLRATQFPEDNSPLRHPIRPETYIEINNFYTATVYEKGAEVVHLYARLAGRDGFVRGVRQYLNQFDGQAATCDDFRSAMAAATGLDLSTMERWYQQAGTPRVRASHQFTLLPDGSAKLVITLGQNQDPPLPIPVQLGLVDDSGQPVKLVAAVAANDDDTGETITADNGDLVLVLREAEQRFLLNVPRCPTPEPTLSILRDFSAPVYLDHPSTDADLGRRLAADRDGFNRWDAGQALFTQAILALASGNDVRANAIIGTIVTGLDNTLNDPALSPAMKAQMLAIPPLSVIAELVDIIDIDALYRGREGLRTQLGHALADTLSGLYASLASTEPYRFSHTNAGRRSLRNAVLSFIAVAAQHAPGTVPRQVLQHYEHADNMTDRLAAITLIAERAGDTRERILEDFAHRWVNEPLVLGKWFAVQAAAPLPDTTERVRALLRHPAFSLKNPNKVFALIGTYAFANLPQFHRPDGAGYQLLVEQALIIDRINPSVAAHLLEALTRWRRHEPTRRALMQAALESVQATPSLSPDTFEIVSKSLA